jgi:hypothetical protein
MKRIKLILLLIALVVFIGLIILSGFLYFKDANRLILIKTFYIYFSIGFILYIVGIVTVRKKLKSKRTAKDFILSSLSNKPITPLLKLRIYSYFIFSSITNIMYWPAGILLGINSGALKIDSGKDSFKKYIENTNAKIFDHWLSIYAFLILLIGYSLVKLGLQSHGYGLIFMYISIACVVIKHIDFLLEPTGITSRLRRLSSKPFIIFLTILFFDFLTLVFSFTLITSKSVPPEFSYAGASESINSLYKFQQFSILFEGKKLNLNEMLMGISGLMFYLALIRNVFNIKEFKRNDEDIIWLMARYNQQGKYKACLRLVKQLKGKSPGSDYNEIVACIGDNNMDRARKKLSQIKTDFTLDEHHTLYVQLFNISFLNNFDKSILLELIEEAIIYDFPDVLLMDSIVIMNETEEFYLKALEIINQFAEKYPFTLLQLYIQLNRIEESLLLLKSLNVKEPFEIFIKSTKELQILIFSLKHDLSEKKIFSLFELVDNTLSSIGHVYKILKTKYEKLIFYGHLNLFEIVLALFHELFLEILPEDYNYDAAMKDIVDLKLKIKEEFLDDEGAQLQFKAADNMNSILKQTYKK